MTHDVELSLDKKIAFPAICVVCEKPDPDGQVELSFLEEKFSVTEAASTMLTGSTYHVEAPSHTYGGVPVCAECGQRLKAHHTRLKVTSYVSWALSVVLAFVLPVSLGWKIAAFVFFLILPGIVSVVYPPALDVTISKGAATFSFTSQKVADEFKSVNS